jgi:glycosyltransferase involved in cell wall biosynthesis
MQTALLSPPKDPEKLAQNILKLLYDDNLRLRLAKAGHEKILSFNWENSTTMLEDFLHRYVPKD